MGKILKTLSGFLAALTGRQPQEGATKGKSRAKSLPKPSATRIAPAPSNQVNDEIRTQEAEVTSTENMAQPDVVEVAVEKPPIVEPVVIATASEPEPEAQEHDVFSGNHAYSNSSNFVFGWFTAKSAATSGEEVELSRYALLEMPGKRLLASDVIPTGISNAVVSDSGYVLLWSDADEAGVSSLKVISSDGSASLDLGVYATVFNAGISAHGTLACVQTSISKGESSNKFLFIDVALGKFLFEVVPNTRWADGYRFDEEAIRVYAEISGVGEFGYTADGTFLSDLDFGSEDLNSTRYSVIIEAAEALLDKDQASTKSAEIVVKAIIRARSLGADRDSSWNPEALKVQGLALERLGQYEQAIYLLELASSLKPKIRVKRKVDSMKAKLEKIS